MKNQSTSIGLDIEVNGQKFSVASVIDYAADNDAIRLEIGRLTAMVFRCMESPPSPKRTTLAMERS